MDLYFERCDGKAATVEDFLACFADAAGRDLSQFMRWYEQAGTPVVSVTQRFDRGGEERELHLHAGDAADARRGREGAGRHPDRHGASVAEGAELELRCDHPDWRARDGVFTLRQASAEITFRDIAKKPVASLLRGFSAPVRLDHPQPIEELLLLAGHDSDGFNRWQAISNTYGSRST